MMLVTNRESSKNVPTRAEMPIATTIDTIAITSGTKAAATAPNTMIRIMRAIGTPKDSPFLRSSCYVPGCPGRWWTAR